MVEVAKIRTSQLVSLANFSKDNSYSHGMLGPIHMRNVFAKYLYAFYDACPDPLTFRQLRAENRV